MFVKLFCFLTVAHIAFTQEITFKDGNIGVGFGGYEAQAGLGGLLTGNAAHGGLSASARTPGGQSAVAGLGGTAGSATGGGLYAGATAGQGVGATAALGGDVGSQVGYGGAEAHAGGVAKQVVGTVGGGVVSSGVPLTSVSSESSSSSDSSASDDSGLDDDDSSSDDSTSNDSTSSNVGSVNTVTVQKQVQPAVYQVQKTVQPVPVVYQKTVTPVVYQKTVQPVVYQKAVQPIVYQKTYRPAVYQVQKTYQPVAQPALVQTYAPQPVNVVYPLYKGFYKTYQPLAPIPRPVYNFGKVVNVGYTPIKTVAVAQPVTEAPVTQAPVTQAPIPDDQRPVLYQKTYSYQYQPVVYNKEVVATRIQSDEADTSSSAAVADTSSVSSDASTATGLGSKTYTIDYTGYKTALYNDIFNIPINALRAVNTLLNNKASGAYNFQKTIRVI